MSTFKLTHRESEVLSSGRWSRRSPKTVLALVAVAILQISGARALSEPTPSRPNFVVIMADDLGYGDIGPYGGWIRTPHLDRLAAEGMRFSDFHSSGNVCSPTRAGLLTGRYQQRASIPGVIFADPKRPTHTHGIQPQEVTFADYLGEAGYRTAIFGKWHLGYSKPFNPVRHGFDRFRGYVSGNVDFFSHVDQAGNYDWWHQDKHAHEDGYVTHLITKHAVDFLREKHNRPFCLYLPHEAPHYPYQGPNDKAERKVGAVRRTQGSRGDVKKAYREMVQEMDRGIGEIMQTLKEQGLDDNTFVFFFSDNGANRNGSNGPLRGGKGSNWEGGHRVPCIVRHPKLIKAGSTSDALAISLDIFPTLVEAARLDVPKERPFDGISLLPILKGDVPHADNVDERKLFWNGRAMRDGTWKLIVNGKGSKGVGLYDLRTDIGEKKNLAEREPQRVERMLAALQVWQRDVAAGATPQPTSP